MINTAYTAPVNFLNCSPVEVICWYSARNGGWDITAPASSNLDLAQILFILQWDEKNNKREH